MPIVLPAATSWVIIGLMAINQRWAYELGPIRPPSEGRDRSLLIRASRNCPWNRCRFCTVYKGQRFEYRSPDEIKSDIDVARSLAEELRAASWQAGLGGRIDDSVLRAVIRSNPDVYGPGSTGTQAAEFALHSLVNVASWLTSGGRTAFLQDADSLVIRTNDLVEVLDYLKQSLPSLDRVTCYARAKSASRKSLEELQRLHRAGLSRVHVGMESGDDQVLAYMQKGVTAAEQIDGGRKIKAAGISLSEYVMPGLGGKKWSHQHASNSAEVLNSIGPDFIRLRSLMVGPACPVHEQVESGEFDLLTEDETVAEIGLLIENLTCPSYLTSDQMVNLLWEVEGELPGSRQAMLDTIASYLSMDPFDRLRFRLERRRRSFFSVYGGLTPEISQEIQSAVAAIESRSAGAGALVEKAIASLKGHFI